MKKLIALLSLSVFIAVLLCACGTPTSGKVIFHYDDEQIDSALSENEVNEIYSIVKDCTFLYDNPSCGFSNEIAVQLGFDTYAVACDGDSIIRHNGKYASLGDDEMRIIHRIMRNHGAHFPCV